MYAPRRFTCEYCGTGFLARRRVRRFCSRRCSNRSHQPVATAREASLRFWARVDIREWEPGACWIWLGPVNKAHGYGRLRPRGSEPLVLAHRFAYEECVGNIPPGLELDHLCRNTVCVNPAHLEPVSHAENVRRGMAGWPGRQRTHCPRGHAYSPGNIYRRPGGLGRSCRECRRRESLSRARPASPTAPRSAPAPHDQGVEQGVGARLHGDSG